MNVKCEKCRIVFKVDPSLIKPKGSQVLCSKCGNTFIVYPQVCIPEISPIFEIIQEGTCPLYKAGDEFQLSGNIFLPPHDKPPCLTLVKDVMKLNKYKESRKPYPET
ncbi:zinc-ribbon domain-containing protein, partial [Desulfococcaceae bacterium HSG8]|nr:zinc-ribbon domain-containing protein [Desulfococcaceae bacterium HSG8]